MVKYNYIFKIIFIVYESKQYNFEDSLYESIYTRGVINKKIIFLLIDVANLSLKNSKIDFSNEINFQIYYNFYVSLLNIHISQRNLILKIVKYFPKITKKFIYHLLSIIGIYLKLLVNLIIEAARLYEKNLFENIKYGCSKQIVFAFNFPEHAFNYVSGNDLLVYSSFAEYLISESKLHSFKLISVDEYVRPSKVLEPSDVNHENFLSIPRISIQSKYSALNFFKKIPRIVVAIFRFGPLEALLFLRGEFRGNQVNSLCNYVRSIGECSVKIFGLMDCDFGHYGYRNYDSGNLFSFSYARKNVFPPGTNFQNLLSQAKSRIDYEAIFNEITPQLLTGYIRQVGILSGERALNEVKRELNRNYGAKFWQPKLSKHVVTSLGFESRFSQKVVPLSDEKLFRVIIFDVPVKKINDQISYSLGGDFSELKIFLDPFFQEILEVLKKFPVEIVIKPKYSTIRTGLNENLNNCSKCIVTSPYVRLADLIETSNLVIAHPYTTAAFFTKSLGIDAIYYIPDFFGEIFFYQNSSDIILGKSALHEYLQTTCGNFIDTK